MIDEEKLLKSIEYSNRWNNAKCPDWVIGMIKAQPTFSETNTNVEIMMDYSWVISKLKSGWAYLEKER